jgi:hypothetical protein
VDAAIYVVVVGSTFGLPTVFYKRKRVRLRSACAGSRQVVAVRPRRADKAMEQWGKLGKPVPGALQPEAPHASGALRTYLRQEVRTAPWERPGSSFQRRAGVNSSVDPRQPVPTIGSAAHMAPRPSLP